MQDLSGFQRDLLYVIASLDRPHGLAIKRELERYYGKRINEGRLYPNLDVLVEEDLVRKGQKDRRTNYYELTRTGVDDLLARHEWEATKLENVEEFEGKEAKTQ
ncbi:helix-turn-helix transcriptional regulator [Haloarchaeobius amylolyticus]|uniref:helix-turn-helix transcriptional regulator n=1 Tax=Haloarchaeobius amylolyticus TaxID=1198296 RepID=UPI00226FF185|nr:helix-turn-helix transcriptional regulator [Haloarchaeobius amylolyticus]